MSYEFDAGRIVLLFFDYETIFDKNTGEIKEYSLAVYELDEECHFFFGFDCTI
jgi:hypothetical protein